MKALKINKKYAAWKMIMGQILIINSTPHVMHNEIMHNEKGKNWDEGKHSAIIIPKAKAKLQKPKLYRVLLLNDDYTPMDFVVFVLKNFFKKSFEEAMRIMLNVHHNGYRRMRDLYL